MLNPDTSWETIDAVKHCIELHGDWEFLMESPMDTMDDQELKRRERKSGRLDSDVGPWVHKVSWKAEGCPAYSISKTK